MLTPALIALLSQAPNTTFITHEYGDSTLLVQTVCSPICSSVVSVLDKDGAVIRRIPSPLTDAVFAEATLEYPNGDKTQTPTIVWTDNTPEMLDDEEKKNKE